MKVSMVITTLNRGALLRTSLQRLATLTLPDELIVINDGGPLGDDRDTPAAVEEFAARSEIDVIYRYNDNPGPTICSLARNIGVRLAKHDYIVTSEPELIYLTDVIAQFKELAPHHPEQVVSAGHIYFAPPAWDGANMDVENWEAAIGWVAPHTALWKKEWLVELGGWDEGFPGNWGWDDTDLLTRLRIAGHGQHIERSIRAVHQWHGLGADPNGMNESYFRAKSFMHDENDTTDLIANRGMEWGKLRSR